MLHFSDPGPPASWSGIRYAMADPSMRLSGAQDIRLRLMALVLLPRFNLVRRSLLEARLKGT
jgi:hypothetical protein